VTAPVTPADPLALLRTRSYVMLLVLTALLGVPIAVGAYYFLSLVDHLQTWTFVDLPEGLGFDAPPAWWPFVPLFVAGVIVGLTIRYLPGRGGHSPVDGFKTGQGAQPRELPGVLLAAVASIGLGAVVGPEGPLIALGGGIAVLVARLLKRGDNPQALAVIAAAGSFAAVSALLGSPLLGAFLLLEASGLAGGLATVVFIPGLLAAGTGALVFVGMNSITGLGTLSLEIPDLPVFVRPDLAEFGWAFVIGISAAVLGTAIRRLGFLVRPYIEKHLVVMTPIAGLVIAGLAVIYTEWTDHPSSDVLFSGQTDLPLLLANSAAYSAGALVLLVACKGLAYGISLAGFRGGPVFPAMFIGAAGGIAMSHLPGLPMVAGVAMGIGAMTAVMLRLPLTSVLLATLLLASDGVAVMPLVIVAVVVAYMISAWFPMPAAAVEAPASAAAPPAEPVTAT
jgi:H+/Cl- antiporter ClcA